MEGRKVEEVEEKKKKKLKYRKVKWWKKRKEHKENLSLTGMMRGQKKQEGSKGERSPEARPALEKFGKWLFLLLVTGQNFLSVSAAAEGPPRRTEAVIRMQQEVQVKENRCAEEIPHRWRQPKGEDRTETKKETIRLRCTLLNGSAWSTEKNT